MSEEERVGEELREARWWGSDHMGHAGRCEDFRVYSERDGKLLNCSEQRRM